MNSTLMALLDVGAHLKRYPTTYNTKLRDTSPAGYQASPGNFTVLH